MEHGTTETKTRRVGLAVQPSGMSGEIDTVPVHWTGALDTHSVLTLMDPRTLSGVQAAPLLAPRLRRITGGRSGPSAAPAAGCALCCAMLAIGDSNPLIHIRRPWVNYGLMAACVLGFLLPLPVEHMVLLPAQFAGMPERAEMLAPWPDTHWAWRLIGYQFLHSGWLHLFGNLVMLWVFGDNVEDAMGHPRYLVFFLVCGAAGGVAEGFLTGNPGVPVVGASGAIAGMMGAYLLMHPRARILVLLGLRFPVIVPASVFVGLWITLDVLSALGGSDGEELIAWWAHIGGFATGLLLIPWLRRRDVALLQPADRYPPQAFGRAGRVLLDLTPKTRVGEKISSRVVAGIKAAGFLLLIAVLVEVFLS